VNVNYSYLALVLALALAPHPLLPLEWYMIYILQCNTIPLHSSLRQK